MSRCTCAVVLYPFFSFYTNGLICIIWQSNGNYGNYIVKYYMYLLDKQTYIIISFTDCKQIITFIKHPSIYPSIIHAAYPSMVKGGAGAKYAR